MYSQAVREVPWSLEYALPCAHVREEHAQTSREDRAGAVTGSDRQDEGPREWEVGWKVGTL